MSTTAPAPGSSPSADADGPPANVPASAGGPPTRAQPPANVEGPPARAQPPASADGPPASVEGTPANAEGPPANVEGPPARAQPPASADRSPADTQPADLEVLRAHLAVEPDDPVGWQRLAGTLIESRMLDEAMDAATRACELAPQAAVAHRYRAIVHVLRGEHASALPVLTTALELDPDDAEAQALVAVCLFEQGADLGEVKAAAARAVATDPANRAAGRVANAVRAAAWASWVALIGPLAAPLAIVLLGGWAYADAGTATVGAQLMLWTGVLATACYLPLRLAMQAFERRGVLRPPGTIGQVIASVAAGLLAAAVVALAGPRVSVSVIFGVAVAGLSLASARHLRGRLQGKP